MALSLGKYRGWIAVFGGFLVHLTLGTVYTDGNMTPYLISYIRQRSSPSDLTYKAAVWVLSLQVCFQGLVMFVGGYISRRIGPRWTALLGGWFMSTGVALTYFTVSHSFPAALFTYGVMFGTGVGIAYAPPLACAMKWMPEKKGLVNGLVLAGYGGGPFIFDQIQTAFLNPTNLSPNATDPVDPGSEYFDNKEILDKVPVCFLLLGGTYAVMQLIGALLITDPPEKLKADDDEKAPFAQPSSKGSLNYDLDIKEDESSQKEPQVVEAKSVSPGSMLRRREFYMLWFMFFLNGVGVVFISTLWKAFGQTKIHDDRFLALVGAFSAVLNALGRPFWGWLADRFSFKVAMMGLCASMIFFTLTLLGVPHEASAGAGAKAMFFIWVCGIFGSFCGNFSLFPTATAKTFGPDYVAVNYGIVFTSNVVSSLTGGIITSALMSALGWFGMFSLVSAMTAISGVIAFFFKVKGSEGKDI